MKHSCVSKSVIIKSGAEPGGHGGVCYDVCANGPHYALWHITAREAQAIGTFAPHELAAKLKTLKHPITTDSQKLADELVECGIAATYEPFM